MPKKALLIKSVYIEIVLFILIAFQFLGKTCLACQYADEFLFYTYFSKCNQSITESFKSILSLFTIFGFLKKHVLVTCVLLFIIPQNQATFIYKTNPTMEHRTFIIEKGNIFISRRAIHKNYSSWSCHLAF